MDWAPSSLPASPDMQNQRPRSSSGGRDTPSLHSFLRQHKAAASTPTSAAKRQPLASPFVGFGLNTGLSHAAGARVRSTSRAWRARGGHCPRNADTGHVAVTTRPPRMPLLTRSPTPPHPRRPGCAPASCPPASVSVPPDPFPSLCADVEPSCLPLVDNPNVGLPSISPQVRLILIYTVPSTPALPPTPTR